MQQGLKDVGAKVTGFSEGVVDSVKGGLSSISHATHSAAGAVVSKPREIASLIRHKFGSTENIPSLKDSLDDPSVDEAVTGAGGRLLGNAAHQLEPIPKYGSEDDCSSATSGSAGANSTTGAPGGPPSSKGNTLERSQSSGLDMLLQEMQELREGQTRLEENLDGLKSHYQRDYSVVMQALQEERFRYRYRHNILECVYYAILKHFLFCAGNPINLCVIEKGFLFFWKHAPEYKTDH